MPKIGIRKLKNSTSSEDVLTEERGQDDYWARWDALAAEIDASWTSDKSAVELVDEQRRDLATLDTACAGRELCQK